MHRHGRATVTALCAAGIGISGLLAGIGHAAPTTAPTTASMTIPVDRQDYVTAYTTTNPSDGTTIDPYDADPSSIHVAISGGKEFARSFVHMALDYLPDGAVPTDLTMTLHLTQQSDASNTGAYPIYNVNNSQAIIQACALVTELPSKFDQSNPPKEDCQHGSAVGKQSSDGQTWTFALKNLLAYWHAHGNTGAALIGVGSGDSSQTWQVAFYRSRSAAVVSYVTGAVPSSTGGGGTTVRGPGPGPGATVVPPAAHAAGTTVVPPSGGTVAPPVGSTPSVAPSGASGTGSTTQPAAGAAGSRNEGGGSTPVWPWVLVGSIAVAGGSIAWAHRATLLASMPQMTMLWRTHPRAYTVSAAALSWGLVFSGYSVVTQPAHHRTELASDQQNNSTNPTVPGSLPTNAPGVSYTPGGPGTNVATNTTGGTTSGGSTVSSNPSVEAAKTEFQGPGTYRVINGVRVFFPANGGVPVAQLYSGADDVVGMTAKQIEICAHAALTYGSAFHISSSDLSVYWNYLRDHGGIFGRTVHGDYTNDNYDPGTAVQAAQTCKDDNTFVLLGGIGFDQIPAVRQWAEQNHELYLHHIATIEGSAGLRYSFSALPTVEQVGTYLGEVAAKELPHKKIAIIYRQSSNWTPALAPFKKLVTAAGSTIVGEYGVQINQGNYTQELTEARSAGAEVILSWENALSEIEMIKQAQGQNWHPAWLVNGFNIITNTLGSTALDQDMWSAAEWDAYDPGYYGGGFSSYASEIKEFEAEYKAYDPSADLTGDGGDLLFLNWESQKWLADLLTTCGKDCTRNKIAGLLLAGYHKVTPPNCPASFDYTGDHHHAGYMFSVLHDVKDPNGRANFVPVARCVTSF
jgi:ABC-type branched-subunit amino acid transport system substrate-binding protein